MFSQKICISLIIIWYPFFVFAGNPELDLLTEPVSCYGKKDGSLIVRLKNGQESYVLHIFSDVQNDTLKRTITAKKQVELPNLQGGDFIVQLLCEKKIILTDTATIPEPDRLVGGKIIIEDMPGSETACDGTISVQPTGGNPPYTYLWSENTGSVTDSIVKDVCYGIYRCEINDSKACGPVHVSLPLFKHAASIYAE